MEVKQIAQFTNDILPEITGESNVINEDLSNIVDAGTAILSSATNKENYMNKMCDRIARFEISNRLFDVEFPSLFRENYEWGSAREVVDIDLLDAIETQSWQLVDSQEYPDNLFYGVDADVKFYNSKTTFTVPVSRTDVQLRTAFLNANEYISFINGLEIAVRNTLTLRKNALARRVINSRMGDTIAHDYPAAAYTASSGQMAINLLYLYNSGPNAGGTALTQADALTNINFLKFAAKTIANISSYMKAPSKAFNISGRVKNTSVAYMHTILLQDFKANLEFYLDSNTFHEEYVALKNMGTVETTPFWQAIGTGSDAYTFGQISKIDVKTAGGNTVALDGIVGVIYDHYSCGITQENPRTTAHYVSSAEFINEWYKEDASYFQNDNEQCVVFFIK